MNTEIRPGKGCSNTKLEFDLLNQEHHSDDVGTLIIHVCSKLDATSVTTIRIQDVYEEDLRAMAKIFIEMADLYKKP